MLGTLNTLQTRETDSVITLIKITALDYVFFKIYDGCTIIFFANSLLLYLKTVKGNFRKIVANHRPKNAFGYT